MRILSRLYAKPTLNQRKSYAIVRDMYIYFTLNFNLPDVNINVQRNNRAPFTNDTRMACQN